MTLFLYVLTVAIWGTTWLAIYYQLGNVDIVVSVFYRFGLATMIMIPLVMLLRKGRIGSRQDQLFFIAQGACLFSLNFLCFYYATQYIPSGLVSVIFCLATIYNAINGRLFFNTRVASYVWLASLFGVAGLALLMAPEIHLDDSWVTTLKGCGLAALGTLFFSFGNMISVRHGKAGITPLQSNMWAMMYGTSLLLCICLARGAAFSWGTGAEYTWSLFYLALFGSVIGFTAYLSLVSRVGPGTAAYTTVLFPVVALSLSALYEGYHWTLSSAIGLLLILVGNYLMINKGRWVMRPAVVRS
ncbi:DMT family transporter [uncultured Alteromonas sp.]|jgi:drug/metabolite transporter (DMT)-like permease|uniref:DMT family transporter n=1 Tax=uncultured Alteromonas sp. TaxID=179113 RepID=UPI0025FC447E|nr:DMT family transporter [uncultured Alteromonas sp.]